MSRPCLLPAQSWGENSRLSWSGADRFDAFEETFRGLRPLDAITANFLVFGRQSLAGCPFLESGRQHEIDMLVLVVIEVGESRLQPTG